MSETEILSRERLSLRYKIKQQMYLIFTVQHTSCIYTCTCMFNLHVCSFESNTSVACMLHAAIHVCEEYMYNSDYQETIYTCSKKERLLIIILLSFTYFTLLGYAPFSKASANIR